MVLLGIITSLFIAIQDPVFQKFAARYASGYLSEKTGGDIKVGRLLITPDFTVFLDDVVVKDLNNNDLANISSLRTRLDLSDLLDGVIHFENVRLRDTKANLIKYEGAAVGAAVAAREGGAEGHAEDGAVIELDGAGEGRDVAVVHQVERNVPLLGDVEEERADALSAPGTAASVAFFPPHPVAGLC